jgi:predicted transcriptional regulator
MMADPQGVQSRTDRIATPPTELTVVQELVYELKVDQVMTRDVITCRPEQTMAELKEVLRVNHISGVPIVQDGRMVGMVSVENLIKALEQGEADHPIQEKMTRSVQAVRADDTVAGAVALFGRYRFGRFPVVDGEGRLVGFSRRATLCGRCSSAWRPCGTLRRSGATVPATSLRI